MVGANHSTNTDDVPGTGEQTISQNKLGYAAVTPPTPAILLTLTFPTQLVSHLYRDPGWLGEALSPHFHGCQDRIAKTVLSDIGSEKFLHENSAYSIALSKAHGPQLTSRGWGSGFLPHPQEGKEPEKSW